MTERHYRYIKDGMDMHYYIMLPDNYDINKKYPLVVNLHGAGTYGMKPEDMPIDSPEMKYYRLRKPECVMLVPLSNFETWSSQQRNLKHLIDVVIDKFNIDVNRVSICGGSMGGFGTWDMITEYPDFFAAASPFCGGGMAWATSRIKDLPIRIYHGDDDALVIPERSIEMFNALKAHNPENGDITLTLIPGAGHNAWEPAYKDGVLEWLISKSRRTFDVYASGCAENSGIYRYKLTDGKLSFVEKYDIDDVMYMKIKRSKLYALLKTPYSCGEGGVLTYDVHKSRLVNKSAIQPAFGKATCHLDVDADMNVYLVNYVDGNVAKINAKTGVTEMSYHKGDGINKPRQDKEHTHQVCFTPDNKYFTVCDLGTDKIHIYNKELTEISYVDAVPGSGPRHIIFNENGKYAYCINELDNTVTVYEYDDGSLTRLDSYDMLPFGYDGLTTAAAIRINGKYLYASTRGHDSITRFEISSDGSTLKYVDNVSCEGKRPRDINISPDGKSLISANEGGNITLFDIENDGSLKYTDTQFELPGALCVIFA